VPVTPPIGTRRSCLFELVRDWQLAFQVDRVNVTLSGEEVESKPESSARRDQLVPAGRQITAAGLFR
jgi:hypothetical protein